MLRMVICCLGGMSSSALSVTMGKQLIEKHLEDKVSVAFCPFHDLKLKQKEYDIAMLCPHLLHSAKRAIDSGEFKELPLYMIPPQMYGLMNLEALYEDALDIVEQFKQKPMNLCHFEGEEHVLTIKRNISHRNWLKRNK